MKHRSCHDCHKASEEVEIRQSDYLLCNACDEIRRKAVREMWANPKSPNPDPNNVDKTDNGLANKVASTADIAKKPTPPLNTNGATERPPPTKGKMLMNPVVAVIVSKVHQLTLKHKLRVQHVTNNFISFV